VSNCCGRLPAPCLFAAPVRCLPTSFCTRSIVQDKAGLKRHRYGSAREVLSLCPVGTSNRSRSLLLFGLFALLLSSEEEAQRGRATFKVSCRHRWEALQSVGRRVFRKNGAPHSSAPVPSVAGTGPRLLARVFQQAPAAMEHALEDRMLCLGEAGRAPDHFDMSVPSRPLRADVGRYWRCQ